MLYNKGKSLQSCRLLHTGTHPLRGATNDAPLSLFLSTWSNCPVATMLDRLALSPTPDTRPNPQKSLKNPLQNECKKVAMNIHSCAITV